MQRWLILLVVAGFGLIAAWWMASGTQDAPLIPSATDPDAPMTLPPTTQETVPQPSWVPPALHYDTYESRYGPLPESLRDTPIPFNLSVDEQNQLVPTHALRRLFEYFFTTVGEEPLDTIIARLKELLQTQLPEPAASQALTALDQYVALKEAELALEERIAQDFAASGRALDVHERGRLLRDLRATHLPRDLYQAFYGEEDRRDNYALQRLDIVRNSQLSDADKAAALQKLEADLPPALQNQVREQRLERELNQRIDQARAQGASQAEIFQLRAETYGVETAQRFAEADQRKAQLEARIQAYRAERAAILASPAFTESDKTQHIEQLRQQHFDAQEQARIPTIDRMWDERETGQAR